MAMSEANFLKKMDVSGDIPPLVEDTSGVNVPCSTLRILALFFRVS